jgi:hypothetical protein
MNNSVSLLAAALVSVAATSALLPSAHAQSSAGDGAYCRSLIQAYMVGGNPVGTETAVAIAQCRDGNAAAAIPFLERKVRDVSGTLPRHG